MMEYHGGKWVVYTLPIGGGITIASCWIGVAVEIPASSEILYEGKDYEDAQQYIADVRDLVIKPKGTP